MPTELEELRVLQSAEQFSDEVWRFVANLSHSAVNTSPNPCAKIARNTTLTKLMQLKSLPLAI